MGIRGGSSAFIKFNEDGGATVISGVVDNGQGNENMIVQIAAEELGLLPEDIQLITADTEVTPSDPGSYSMCETFIGGNAVRLAAIDAKEKLFQTRCPRRLRQSPGSSRPRDRKIFVKGEPERSIPVGRVIRMALSKGQSIAGEGSYWPKVDPKREWVDNPFGQLSETFSFGTTMVEVKVDPETGLVDVLEAWASQDVGFALNPKVIEGQFEGGLTMGGQGGMLTEYHIWDGGRLLNPGAARVSAPARSRYAEDQLDHRRKQRPRGALRSQGGGHVGRHVGCPGLRVGRLQCHRGAYQRVPHNARQDNRGPGREKEEGLKANPHQEKINRWGEGAMQALVIGGTGGMGQGVARDLIKQEQIEKGRSGRYQHGPGQGAGEAAGQREGIARPDRRERSRRHGRRHQGRRRGHQLRRAFLQDSRGSGQGGR